MVVHGLTGQRVRTVALHFGLQHTDLLGVTAHTSFTDVDVTTNQSQRFVWLDAFGRLRGRVLKEQRYDLYQASEGNHQDTQDDQQPGIFLDRGVRKALISVISHDLLLRPAQGLDPPGLDRGRLGS